MTVGEDGFPAGVKFGLVGSGLLAVEFEIKVEAAGTDLGWVDWELAFQLHAVQKRTTHPNNTKEIFCNILYLIESNPLWV
jgi:hypothetical protein